MKSFLFSKIPSICSAKRIAIIALIVPLVVFSAYVSRANEIQGNPLLSVSGIVKFPFHYTLKSLDAFKQVKIRVTEADSTLQVTDAKWYESYWYEGVPLAQIIEASHVWKENVSFPRLMDLVIVVHGQNGKAVLTWPEICNMDSGKAIIALRGDPVPPLTTKIPKPSIFPRLVMGDDFYNDRYIDGVYNIEVLFPAPPVPFNRGKGVYVPGVTIKDKKGKEVIIDDLKTYKSITVSSLQSGHDKGYYGVVFNSGVSLVDILKKEKISFDSQDVLVVTSSDGYRAVISYGELYLSSKGKRILFADKVGDKAFGHTGKYNLVFPDDYNADRWVKTVKSIDVVGIAQDPKIYLVNVAYENSSRLTMEQLSIFGKANLFICDKKLLKGYGRYMGNKPVLFDPLENTAAYHIMKDSSMSMEEAQKKVVEIQKNNVSKIKESLSKGENIVFMDIGLVPYGSWSSWIYDYFDKKDIVIVPGVSE